MPTEIAENSLAIIWFSGEVPQELPRIGGFSSVRHLVLPGFDPNDRLAARLAAARLAQENGAQWHIAMDEGEAVPDDALELATPALGLFDAIFGAAHLRGSDDPVIRLSRLAFDTQDRLPHALLHWWLPESHFVRTKTAIRVLESLASADAWPIDYLFALWSSARCLKSAQPLLELTQEPRPLTDASRDAVLRRLAEAPVFLPIVHGDRTYHLPYTGRNAGIEREQTRGLFFEADELEVLRGLIGERVDIVDVGANTGNHTVFFAGPMRAKSVIPLEPLPEAALALRRSVERNGLVNVDLSRLGIGVGERRGCARVVSSTRGGLGATSLVADPQGEIAIAPLDEIITTPIDFLKIDVEGMEMAVLAGAARLIGRYRPKIFIEIANRNTPEFSAWLDAAGYEVTRIFTDKGHANYLVAPKP